MNLDISNFKIKEVMGILSSKFPKNELFIRNIVRNSRKNLTCRIVEKGLFDFKFQIKYSKIRVI